MTRSALVTGGAKGIGRALTARLAADGHDVVAVGRDGEAVRACERGLAGLQGRVRGLVADVSDPVAVDGLVAELGGVDILVLNAGMAATNRVARTSLEEWNAQLAVNATAAFLCVRGFLEQMVRGRWGRIVAIGSTASHVGAPYAAAYTASKHALLGFMRALATELAGTGVTANTVCPTFVRSPMTDRSLATIRARTGRDEAAALEVITSTSPLHRLLDPEEVAAAVAFFVGDSAAAINGQSLVLDGGGIQR